MWQQRTNAKQTEEEKNKTSQLKVEKTEFNNNNKNNFYISSTATNMIYKYIKYTMCECE